MTVITNSNATLQPGQSGSWWEPATGTFVVDIDTEGEVSIQTRRKTGDTSPKPLWVPNSEGVGRTTFKGPLSMLVQSVAGREYRFQSVAGPAVTVAADE